MEQRDLITTPIVIMLVLMGAYLVRPYVTDNINRRYFFPALFVKIVGAISVGLIYQFYYNGGDTFMYHTYGSRLVWTTFFDSPFKGITLLFRKSGDYTDVYEYASRIYFFKDPSSYSLVRLASVFDLLTLSSYAATSVLFACFGFVGIWSLYLTFYQQYPWLHRNLAVAICFIPSVFFWSSGILKETIVVACLGVATFQLYSIIIVERKVSISRIVLLILALYYIFVIKKFILQAFIPAVIVWLFVANLSRIRSLVLRLLMIPFVSVIELASAYYSVVQVGKGDEKYALDKIAETAKITAYDIRYWTGRDAGSGYDLGILDGTIPSMFRLAPQAINVSLFRPYLWEVKNPLMLFSAAEGAFFLLFATYIFVKKRSTFLRSLTDPNIIFCLVFSLSFAFAVGVSTFNFGTLVRYKTPMLPFFLLALVLMLDYKKSDKKFSELDSTE